MKMTFEVPEDLKAEEIPELHRRYVEFLKDAKIAFSGSGVDWDGLIAEFEGVEASSQLAADLLNIYWLPRDSAPSQESKSLARDWFERQPRLDETFLFTLIEMAGERALRLGHSKQMSAAAKAKNAAPRSWVLQQWLGRTDHGQSKASFSRQHAALVKSKFSLDVTPETISRDWLPKG
jgi:hypothetical protein